MAEIKTFAHNYNIPLQEAFKQRRPLFLGSVASTSDYHNLVAKAYEEIGVSNFDAKALDKALYQLNDDVDLEAEVPVVAIEPRFQGQNAKVLRKRFPKEIKEQVLSAFENGIVNEDTGIKLFVTSNAFNEHIKFDDKDVVDGLAQLEAIAALPELARTAKLVESYDDKKNVEQIKQMHRFQGAVRIGDKDYSVKLTVKEFKDGIFVIDDNSPFQLYHHRLEKELLTGNSLKKSGKGEPEQTFVRPSASSSNMYTLRTLLEDVKDSEGKNFFQTKQVMLAEERLQADLEAWEKTVDSFESGTLNSRKPVVMLKNTPLVLTLLGADKNLTVSTNYRTLNKVLVEKHKLPVDVLKQVPRAMTDPIMIFKSATVANDYVMMLDLKDDKGATVVVPVSLDYDGIGGYTVNYVPSVYGKANEETGRSNNQWFINQIEQGNLVYQNNKKSREWRTSSGLQLPRVGSDLITHGKVKIYTEKDLVNLKNANPTYYQHNKIIQGSINQVEGAKSIIRFFTATDISTGFHEFGHYMRFGLEQKALLENAREQDKQDWQTACDYVGAKFGETWTREQEEKFADSVLLYLQTGEAPSKGLKRVFANIARWLTKLYTKVTQTNIAITPEIKDVFDRQLATEKEILAARQKIGIAEMNPLLTNLQETDLSYLSAEERERFNTLVQEADAETYTAMIAKKGKELSEKKQAWAKNARLAYELEPDITEIRQVIYEGGIYFDEQMQNQYKESLQALYENNPELYAKLFTTDKSKAVDLDKIAERFNKEGAGAIASLMGHIARIPHEQAFIEQYIQEQEQAWRESWDNTELLLNDNVEEALGILANALAKKIGHTSFDTKQLHSIVVDKVKENKIGEVENLIEKYEVTAKENALLEKASARKIQKLEAKIIAQRLELLEKKRVAIAVLREKYKAKELKNKGVQYVKRVAKTKPEKIDFAYSEQIKALGNKFGITGKLLAPRDKENLPSLAQFVADNQLDSSIFPEWLLASPQDENIRYKDLSVEEFKDLMNVFTLLEHKGKDIKQVELLGKKQSLEERVKELNASASQLEDKKSITDWERNYNKSKKVRSILRSLGADLTNYVYTFLAADGYRKDVDQVNGVFYQTFLAPLYEAQKTSYRLSCVMNEKIQTVLDPIINMKKEKRQERWSLPDVPLSYEVARVFGENNSWDYEKMIMVALNMGNADNMKKLMNGFGWERKHLDLITQRMTKEDWQMVQNIWDTINELYPELDAVYKKVNGIPMKKIEANKLETPYGVLEGGYFPLVFDSRLASIDQNAKLELEKLQQNSFSINIAKTVDSFTKTRKGNANIPLKLSFDIIDKHIQDSIQYISYEPSIHNIRKVIHNNDFASMYKDKFSVDVYNGLEAWLANIAKPQRDTITTTERLLEKTRELGTLYALGYNIKTALMSFTGLAPIVHEVGLINTIKGAGYLLKNRGKAYQQIQEISTLMADRPKNINQDIAQNMAKFNPTNAPTLQINAFGNDYNIYWKDIQKFAFSMVTATDAMVSYTGWIAAYNKAMQETNGDIEKARAYADLVVERSQSSGTAMHLTALQRGHGIKKIITMFMTYSLNYWNNLQYQTRGLKEGKVSALEYASWILWYHTMPAILTVMINGLWKEGEIPNPFGDDDDEDKYKGAKEYGQEIFINGLIQGLPVVRNIPSLFEYNQSNMTGSSVMDNGLVSTARSFYNGGLLFYSLFDDSLESEDIWGKFIKHSIDSSSYWTGIPAHKVLQLYEKANKVLDWYQN